MYYTWNKVQMYVLFSVVVTDMKLMYKKNLIKQDNTGTGM